MSAEDNIQAGKADEFSRLALEAKERRRKENSCPKCGKELKCLAGESAHPRNWYCTDNSCGYTAWTDGYKLD